MHASRALLALAFLVLAPAAGFSQGTIAGVVRDTSGAVLPGVTVEASSPALIEKVRTAATDGTGQYQVINLVPGTYAVTFTLPGFNTVRREGIELTGTFTATINAEMRVGALEETITVTGETPIVDVQGTTRQQVLGREVIDTIPAGRTTYNIGVLIPGVSIGGPASQDVGGSTQNTTIALVAHGSRYNDQASIQNGVSIAAMADKSWFSPILYNPTATQEVVIDTSAVNVELPSGGVRTNVITRDGGNDFRATIFGNFANNAMQGSNFTDDLRKAGLRAPGEIRKLWDFNPGLGGPLKRDRLWFYLSGRYTGISNYAAGIFSDLNTNNPSVWSYAPDVTSKPVNDLVTKDGQMRFTLQASDKNKIGFVWHEQKICGCPANVSATNAIGQKRAFPLQRLLQADWTSPVTNRLLLEAGAVSYMGNSVEYPLVGLNTGNITVVEQSNGLTYRGNDPYRERPNSSKHVRVAVSYVTGTHAFKGGVNHTSGWARTRNFAMQPVTYRFNNGVPNQLTQFAYPFLFEVNVDHNMGIFAQDKWTVGRLTLTGGLRYDYFANSFPESSLGPTVFIPARNVTFPASDNLSLHDITPRVGGVYDVFGNGKTAVKTSLNKYLSGLGSIDLSAMPHPVANAVLNANRSWSDANRNFVPDCDLTSAAANGECGQLSNPDFGSIRPGATFDPDILRGWGKRGYNWEFSAGVQQEIMPRVAVDMGYFRRWYGNEMVTDNRTLTPADFTSYSITVPVDPRLPNGGGYKVSGLFDVNPNKFGLPAQNFVTFAKNYGRQSDVWNGIDLNTAVRPRNGMMLQGGFSSGRRATDMCEIARKLPLWLVFNAGATANALVQSNSFINVGAGRNLDVIDTVGVATPLEFCEQDSGWLTQVKLLGSYLVPKIGVQIAGTLQNLPGKQIAASYVATNAVVSPSLGRNLSGNAANVTVNIVKPGTLYGERLNQLDLRFGKSLTIRRVRTMLNLDVYNAFNDNTVLTFNSNFASWQQPQSILTARFAKASVQLDF
jgi:Carboxypeptidase regulatory-like domain